LRIYNLSKSARDEIVHKITGFTSAKPKDLKIAEPESDGDSSIIFDREERLYVGQRRLPSGEELIFPLLKDERILPKLPVVTVDSGAVKFVCNGANIMRPGITKLEGDDFAKGGLLVVREQKYGKAIAVGRALLSRKELESASKGPVVENVHYVGDRLWDSLKEIDGPGQAS